MTQPTAPEKREPWKPPHYPASAEETAELLRWARWWGERN